MNKTQRINLIAFILLAAFAVFVVMLPALAHSADWEFAEGYNTWTVTIGHTVEYEHLNKTAKDVDVKIEIVTYGDGWTKIVLTATETTDWVEVREWVRCL